jgi:hypothetical protein
VTVDMCIAISIGFQRVTIVSSIFRSRLKRYWRRRTKVLLGIKSKEFK